jgi:hypothetical protein
MSKRSRSSESRRRDATTLYLAGGAISVPGLLLPAVGVDDGLTLMAPAGALLILGAVVSREAGDAPSAPTVPLEQRPGSRRGLLIAVGAGWVIIGLFQLAQAL